MTIPSRWLPFVEAAARGLVPSIRERAESLLYAHRAAKARVRAKQAPRKKAEKLTRSQRNDATAHLRRICSDRAGGRCELCGQTEDGRAPLEMHHLLPGRGRRTQQQAKDNCVMVCGMCHAIGHGRILMVGDNLLRWAKSHSYSATEAVIRRRIDKALVADPSWPRDAAETARLGPSTIPESPAP
jgi:5-methylcytosine-specific restriction endonuclease McrA